VAPQLLALVSSSGQPISVYSSLDAVDPDALSSLAAGSFAATRQMANLMTGSEFTLMFHEGTNLNVHISQVSDQVLLVVCFSKKSDIGVIRLISKRAASALNEIFNSGD
jgi:predicted regulator of Ras-like GTPase activity (Roadblock/LC7/MglB family)